MPHSVMPITGCAGHCPSGELGGASEGAVVNPDLAIVAGDNGPDDGKSEPLHGALYYASFFQDGAGTVIVFVPVAGVAVESAGRSALLEVPAADLAIMVHERPFDELDLT